MVKSPPASVAELKSVATKFRLAIERCGCSRLSIPFDPPGFVLHQSESRAQMRSRTPLGSSRDVKYAGRYFRHDRGEKSTIAVCDVARDDDGHWQERFSA
jgi:hypothetical protein